MTRVNLFVLAAVGALAASAEPITQPFEGNYYQIANPQGDVLSWDNGTLRALPVGDCEYQDIRFEIADVDGEYYNIIFEGIDGVLAGDKSNGWTPVISSSPESDLAKYTLITSSYDSDYVNIKCKGMNRGSGMLGQDSGNTAVYTDKSDGALSIWQLIPLSNEEVNVESVTIDPAEATIGIYDTVQLTAEVVADSENVRLKWTSSDPTVASVNTKGLVRGLIGGSTDITVTAGDKSATCQVTVAVTDYYSEYDLPDDDVRKDAHQGYKLVFAEEFSTDGDPDYDIWNLEDGYRLRNNEDQYYLNPNSTNGQLWGLKNAYIQDGVLVIEARKDDLPNPDYYPHSGKAETFPYTSASLQTKGSWNGGYSWLFGIYEVRAKITAETGLWPAIWSTGEQYEWPQGGEIDIMEYYGNKLHANVCWGNGVRWGGSWNSKTYSMSNLPADWDQDFHTWKMVWDYDHMELWVDDILINDIDLNTTVNVNPGTDWYNIDNLNPFRDVRQMCWLNLALGGNNGGSLANTTFPSYYLIDYVRIYQKIGTDGLATYHVDEEVSEPTWQRPNGIKSVAVDDIDDSGKPVRIFDLSGREVAPSDTLRGLYLVNQGTTTRKVIF